MKALRIGLLTFVPAKTGIVGTLFDPVSGRTADGTYKKRRNGVQFFDAKDRPWFFLVANKYNERFFVSTGESNGKIFYAFGLAEDVKNRIGLSYSKLSDLANEVWEKVVEGRELETNPPMYAHHLNEIKAHGLSVKQMRRLYAMVSRGNQKAITFARNVFGIPFDETASQVKAVVKHHVLDLQGRGVKKNPYYRRGKGWMDTPGRESVRVYSPWKPGKWILAETYGLNQRCPYTGKPIEVGWKKIPGGYAPHARKGKIRANPTEKSISFKTPYRNIEKTDKKNVYTGFAYGIAYRIKPWWNGREYGWEAKVRFPGDLAFVRPDIDSYPIRAMTLADISEKLEMIQKRGIERLRAKGIRKNKKKFSLSEDERSYLLMQSRDPYVRRFHSKGSVSSSLFNWKRFSRSPKLRK